MRFINDYPINQFRPVVTDVTVSSAGIKKNVFRKSVKHGHTTDPSSVLLKFAARSHGTKIFHSMPEAPTYNYSYHELK